MSWRNAPLYVRAHDLARWTLAHVEQWPATSQASLRERVSEAVLDLLEAVAAALTFPALRATESERADRCVAHLRVLLRLAVELGRTEQRQSRFACGELDVIGRMLGGWRKAARLRAHRARTKKGDGAQTAPTA